MNVVSIGSDPNLLVKGSSVRSRMAFYGRAVDELHIIVPGKGTAERISENVFLHPTGTTNPFVRTTRAVSVGRTIPHCTLVTAQDPFEYGIAALRLGAVLKVPVELQVHTDIGSSYFGRGFSAQEMRNKIRKIGLTRRLKKAAGVRVVSERVAHAVERFGISRSCISVLPMFIDTKHLTSVVHTPSPSEQSVVMAGRLEKEKEYPTAFRAFARVLNIFPGAHLYITGDGRLRNTLLLYAQKRGIGHAVTFLGAVPDIAPYLASAHVFLHTSQYEGFGATIAEAALVGTPIVSTDVGIAGSILHDGEHGRIVPVGDVEKIAEALIETLTHPQKVHERALSAMGAVQKELLSPEVYIQKLKSIWSSYTTT